jgi:hypothetical protein
MKTKLILAAALTLAALEPGIASASFVLDTGTPPAGTASALLNTSDWYAAEFSVTAGETINSLSAYLTQGAGTVGDSYTWDIYSTAYNFLGANRAAAVYSVTGNFTANGWNTTAADWTPTTSGLFWVALQVSSTGQTRGLDLVTESSTSTGTAPAIAFASATGSASNPKYVLETTAPVGLEVSAVPLPAAVWLLGSGLIGFGARMRRRRS